MKTFTVSINLKISAIFLFSMLFLASLLAITSSYLINNVALNSARDMVVNKLAGDINSTELYIESYHGELIPSLGTFVNASGRSLDTRNDLIDKISKDLSVVATVFIREGQDFRRLITSIKNDGGTRAVGTYLGMDSSAYGPIMAGDIYIGEDVILSRNYITGYKPIFDSSRSVSGIIFVGIEITSIENQIALEIKKGLIILTAAAFLALLLCLIFGGIVIKRAVTLPIRRSAEMLKNISEGEGDLTKTLNIKSRDEIGEMGNYFNLTLEKVRNLVITIINQAGILSKVGIELSANMNETAAAVNQISANLQSVKNQILHQSSSVVETNSTMSVITRNIEKLTEHIEIQAASVNQSSTAIEEMLANIASVTNTLAKNSENVRELSQVSEIGREDLATVSVSIREVTKESEQLLEISDVIQQIASQTNLLSMNAAIEAAHAGESGRGFAVVAEEIRKLAESSASQSKTISASLQKIKGSMDSILISTDSVLKQFEDIDKRIKTVSIRENEIRNAMDEQTMGSREILQTLEQLNDITSLVQAGSTEMLIGSREIIEESSNLRRITEEVTDSINEMVSGVEEITVSVNRINDLSGENKDSIDALNSEVNRFIV